MPVPDLSTPAVAGDLASFGGGAPGRSSKINFDVPLPGSYSWQRVVPLELDPAVFADGATRIGTSLLQLGVVQGDQGRLTGIDVNRLTDFYRRALPATARPSLRHVAQVGGDVAPLLSEAVTPRERRAAAADGGVDILGRRALVNEFDDVAIQRRRTDTYIERLANTVAAAPIAEPAQASIVMTTTGIGHSIQETSVNPVAPPQPTIALVETWELRSFLGDYGLGRTLQTFSLLPGERTTITTHTWRRRLLDPRLLRHRRADPFHLQPGPGERVGVPGPGRLGGVGGHQRERQRQLGHCVRLGVHVGWV
jgi:hypothetical protein